MALILQLMVCLAVTIQDVEFDSPGTALRFTPPSGFVVVNARPPAVYEAIQRRRTQEQARLVLFVVPAPPGTPAEEAFTAAMRVAALYGECLVGSESGAELSPDYSHVAAGYGVHAARLAVVRDADRHVGLLLFGLASTVDALAAEFETAARSIAPLTRPLPATLSRPEPHPQHGFALCLPLDFESERDLSEPELIVGRMPAHYGLPAEIRISLVTGELDEPLAQAAEALALELTNIGATVPASGADRLGPFSAVRLDVLKPPYRGVTYLVELDRYRIQVAAAAAESRFEHFAAAFEASARSLVRVPRRLAVDLGQRFDDSENGFTLRPPLGFARTGGREGLVTFRQEHTLPPAAELSVDLLQVASQPESLEDCRKLAQELLDAAPGDPAAPLLPGIAIKLLNGNMAAQYGVAQGAADDAPVEVHWLVAAGSPGRVFDLRFSTTRGDWPVLSELADASIRSFRGMKRTIAPALGERVAAGPAGVSFRPPRGWPRVAAAGALAAFQEETTEGHGARVELGRDPPPPGLKAGKSAAESYRQYLLDALATSGVTGARVESASVSEAIGREVFHYRLAYNVGGRPLRELRCAMPCADGTYYVRAFVAGARFNDYQLLFEASAASLQAGGK